MCIRDSLTLEVLCELAVVEVGVDCLCVLEDRHDLAADDVDAGGDDQWHVEAKIDMLASHLDQDSHAHDQHIAALVPQAFKMCIRDR